MMDPNNNPPLAGTAYRMQRSHSNSNPSLEMPAVMQQQLQHPHHPSGGPPQNVHVEYEVSVPSFRHTPYHSLWNLNQQSR